LLQIADRGCRLIDTLSGRNVGNTCVPSYPVSPGEIPVHQPDRRWCKLPPLTFFSKIVADAQAGN
jgi:hypothetical protein